MPGPIPSACPRGPPCPRDQPSCLPPSACLSAGCYLIALARWRISYPGPADLSPAKAWRCPASLRVASRALLGQLGARGCTACLGGFLCCGYGAGAGGHGVVDGPDPDRVGLVSARGGHAGEAAALLRPPVPAGRGGCYLLRPAGRADRGGVGRADPGRVHLQRQGCSPSTPPASRRCLPTCARRRKRPARTACTSRTWTRR